MDCHRQPRQGNGRGRTGPANLPRFGGWLNNLTVNNCQFLGQFEKAIELGNEALRLDPHQTGVHYSLAASYLALNRVDEAKSVLQAGLTQNPDSSAIHSGLYLLAFVEGDQAGMQRELKWGDGQHAVDNSPRVFAAVAAQQGGHRKQAVDAIEQDVEAIQADGLKESAAQLLSGEALFEAEIGNHVRAKEIAARSLALSRGRSNGPTLLIALSLAGDTSQAQKLLDDLKTRYPEDTLTQSAYIPMAEALIQPNSGDSTKSIEILRPTARFELAPAVSFLPIYVKGLTYLRAHQGREAAAEFQKILNHRGVWFIATEYALANVGLARALAAEGDIAGSRHAYQDFFALWKNADPDIPILKEAKAEYAKLQ
ncbi:MAG: tetratricopeptide repeat protein [Candidatus Sulfotelmatobacter sp.]